MNHLYAVIRTQCCASRSYAQQLGAALPASFRQHVGFLGLVVAYWISGLVVAHMTGQSPLETITMYLPTYRSLVPLMIIALLTVRGLVIIVSERPARPLSQLVREFRTVFATPQRIAHALPVLVSLLVFGGTFTLVKTALPMLVPFAWDVPLEQFDRWLHGGIAPWELLQPILGYPLITHAINWAYNFWFYLFGFIMIWQAFSQRDDRLRLQFFFTLLLGWILLGTIAAGLFSSAGPCYFGRVTGLADPFAPLMAYLQEADRSYPIWALKAQGMLWDLQSMHDVALGSGISAMPSMHVALATLYALVCWRTNRWLGIATTVFALVIQVGSVHLGWHYAIDGYFGAAGMIAIWCVVGRALSRHEVNRRLAVTDAA